MPDNPAAPAYLRTREAAEILGFSYRTLISMRCRGGGPSYRKVGPGGRAVRYKLADLVRWAESRPAMGSISEVAATA